jgi:hypothetical protein
VGSLGVFVLLVAAIITQVPGALYEKGLLGCNETVAEQKGPKGEIGQTVKFSNVAWQVTTVRQATELKAPSYPKKKGNFVIVDFLFTNNADEATKLYPGSLTLLDGEGCEFEMGPNEFVYIDPVYIAPGKNLFSENAENVNPGVTKDGEVIFAVTPDAKDFTLRASDTDPFITDENAYIDLGI